jgi:hypothetical protein
MRLQAGKLADERGMVIARRAHQKAIPWLLFGSQDENQLSE